MNNVSKCLLVFVSLVLSSASLKANDQYEYDKIELRALPEHQASINFDYGILYKNIPYKVFGVYGVIEKSGEFELLAELVLSAYSLGIMANVAGSRDNVIEIEKTEGLQLKSICSNFHGGSIGAAIIAGGNGFYAMNSKGVAMKSGVTIYGTMLDLSYRRVKVKCLNVENPNWEKVFVKAE